jgi:hypothetical protein
LKEINNNLMKIRLQLKIYNQWIEHKKIKKKIFLLILN